MAVLTQTDTPASDGAQTACSGASGADGSSASSQMSEGAAAGSVEQTVKNSSNVAGVAGFGVQSAPGEPGDASWEAGDWTVRLDVTTGNTSVTLQEIHICEWLPSGSSAGTVASLTGIGLAMSAGVHAVTVTQGSEYTPTDANSEIYIVYVFDFGGQHGNQQIGVTPSQDIDAPLTSAAPVSESKTSPSESLADLSADQALPTEVLAHLVVQGQAPSEALALPERSRAVPSEHLRTLVVTTEPASEVLIGLVVQEQGASEALAIIRGDRSVESEHLVSGVAAATQVAGEILKGEEFEVLVGGEVLLGIEAARFVPTEFTSQATSVSRAVVVPTEFFLADAPAPQMFRRFDPLLDGPSEPILDGVPRRQLVEIAAGEYATPLWLETDAGLVIKIDSLPWQGRIRIGSARFMSSDPG